MKILVIDNHTGKIENWISLLSKYKTERLEFVRVENFKNQNTEQYDLIILTGATGLAVPTNLDTYREEFELIRQRTKPLLGVCVGFQAIAVAFGSDLQYRQERIEGLVEINVVKPDYIFGDQKTFKAPEFHKYYVTKAPANFEVLATSIYNVEVIKHISKPIYGFQFHPEVINPPNDGITVFSRLFDQIANTTQS